MRLTGPRPGRASEMVPPRRECQGAANDVAAARGTAPHLKQRVRISSMISTDKAICTRVCMHMYYTVTDPANDFINRWRELPPPTSLCRGGGIA